jgi:hypothetical protein
VFQIQTELQTCAIEIQTSIDESVISSTPRQFAKQHILARFRSILHHFTTIVVHSFFSFISYILQMGISCKRCVAKECAPSMRGNNQKSNTNAKNKN